MGNKHEGDIGQFLQNGSVGMKRIEVKPRIVVLSPWYKIDDAAAYCGMVRQTFVEKATKGELPWGGDANNKRYHVADMDLWIANRFRYPGTEEAEEAGRTPRHRARVAPAGACPGIVNPYTGKIKIYGDLKHGKQA